jgi:hypothetical protein
MSSELSDERLREISAGCEGVTRGPWRAGPQAHYDDDVELYTTEPFTDQIGTLVCDGMNAEHDAKINAAHIARLDPDTVKELCRLALIGLEAERSATIAKGGTDTIDRLTKERDEAIARAEACERQAVQWKGEALAHKSSLHEAYQVLTGATGEPANWNGARPFRQFKDADKEAFTLWLRGWVKARFRKTVTHHTARTCFQGFDGTRQYLAKEEFARTSILNPPQTD